MSLDIVLPLVLGAAWLVGVVALACLERDDDHLGPGTGGASA